MYVVNNILQRNERKTNQQSIKKYLKQINKKQIKNEKENKRARYNGKNENNEHVWTSYGAKGRTNGRKNRTWKNCAQGLKVCADHAHDKKQNIFEKAKTKQINIRVNIPRNQEKTKPLTKYEGNKDVSTKSYTTTRGTKLNGNWSKKNRWLDEAVCRDGCRDEVENSRASMIFNTELQKTLFHEIVEIKITFD